MNVRKLASYSVILSSSVVLMGGKGCGSRNQTIVPAVTSPASAATPGNIGTTNALGFYVQPVQLSPSLTTYFHQAQHANSPSTSLISDCLVNQNETSLTKRDLICYLEIQELDLFVGAAPPDGSIPTGTTFGGTLDTSQVAALLNFNAPPGMCDYVRVSPYFYFGYQPGVGLTAISYNIDATTGTISGITPPGAVTSTGAVVCPYDYTAAKGPNCCVGTYTLKITTKNPPAADVTSTTTNNWGGEVGNCVYGAGADSQKRDKDNNWPEVTIISESAGNANAGTNGVYPITAPIVKNIYNTNLYAANYFDPKDNGGNAPSSLQTQPGLPGFVPQPYYEFGCMDFADDYIARIRVMIRPWDRAADFAAALNNTNSNYYDAGPEPEYGTDYHDHAVWKDFLNVFPGPN